VAGSVTGRVAGGSMSEIGMRVLARGDDARDDVNYLSRTRDGTPVKSSTILLRDSTDTVFGALCVNLDIGAVTRAHELLGALAGVAAAPAELPVTTFGNDIDAVVDAVVDTHRAREDKSWAELDRGRRLELFRALDARGVFAVRRSVEQVATRLGISRASAYNYLSRARAPHQQDHDQNPGEKRNRTDQQDRNRRRNDMPDHGRDQQGRDRNDTTATPGGHA
ncbi:MAG TPA: helix-turn-helix domain-containing protein, partial [Streptomyces sp.]|nr:helix-turn-helix domain-containing protein [Streptomyces sp.]